MNDTPLQSTKRETQGLLRSPLFWTGIAAASVLLGLTGPFGTFAGLGLPARLAYWAVTVFVTYLAAAAIVGRLAVLVPFAGLPTPLAYAIYGAVAGVPVAILVWGINFAVFGRDGAIDLPVLVAYTMVIAAVVSAVVTIFFLRFEQAPAAPGPQPARPRILDRLPPQLRGELSHLSVQDHYVEVRTDRGGRLVLMRLADAIAETGGAEGLQVHRSHWVALNQVAATHRRGGRLVLTMRDGTEVPVSRTYVSAARAAGLS